MSDYQATYQVSDDVTPSDIRSALDDLSEDDISQSSPISEGAPEAGVAVFGDGTAVVTVEGAGDRRWTKTTEAGLYDTITAVEGVEEIVAKEGGRDIEVLATDSDGDES